MRAAFMFKGQLGPKTPSGKIEVPEFVKTTG